jgi:hypothetical protein
MVNLMAKFKKGETSQSVLYRKGIITQSMIAKSELIHKIHFYSDIPSSLEMKKNIISETSVHQWEDSKLGIIKYSWNTAHKEHNSIELAILVESINKANKRLLANSQSVNDNSNPLKSRLTVDEINKIKEENEELRVALAEVYRAYMQLLDEWREDKQVDAAYRKLIIEQANILGKNRAWEVK